MAYSMMSTTNQKRRYDESDCSIEEKNNDWNSLDDLEDFIANDYNDDTIDDEIEDSFFISSSQSSSFFSDAASGVPLLHGIHRENLSKKRKTKETFVDQELEDTASSPTQSPKVNDFNLLYMKSKGLDSRDIICQEIGNTSQQAGDSTNKNLLESELRKKGLCLIPTSTLLNYLRANII